jgi:copper chaperone
MTESVTLKVGGMKCGGCETIVNNKLKTLAGVKSSSASSKSAEVQVEFDAGTTSRQAIIDTINEAGYTVEAN